MQTSAAGWRRKADTLAAQGRYKEAAEAYRKEAAIYRKEGDINAAIVEEGKAARYTSEVRLFAELPGVKPTRGLPKNGTLAKWEPVWGCYAGAFIDRDERLGRVFTDENHQSHYDPDDFQRLTGKKHASVFCYVAYGKRFPSRWVEWLRDKGVAAHIAFEPNGGLGEVADDDYLRDFARDAARSDAPVFLRFASEMNGNWTRYGGNPSAYKAAWKTVYNVMAEDAPNVAMVWCVGASPEQKIPLYYPGDSFVDWVGVNFYSVPFHDNNINRPGLHENPADDLRFVYSLYAPKKPLMICEFGASHLSSVDGKRRNEWAGRKINELYAALPRLYPRVKMVDIFDMDNRRYARSERQLNNYSVTDEDEVRKAYARAVAPEYFLSDVSLAASDNSLAPIVPLADGQAVPRGILNVSVWARCYSENFAVRYLLNGRGAAIVTEPGPRFAQIPLATAGKHRLTAEVRDAQNKVAATASVVLSVR